jgi:hypothetical protein
LLLKSDFKSLAKFEGLVYIEGEWLVSSL